jgi:hypothetical protein
MQAPALWLLAVRRRLSDLISFLLVAIALGLFGLGLLLLSGLANKISGAVWPSSLQQAAGALSAAGLATLGWIVTARNQRRLSRKQHTFNLIIQMRHSDLFQKRMDVVTKRRAPGIGLTGEDVALLSKPESELTDEERDFARASRYLLNYFEFIASSIAIGDLDAELIRRTIRAHMVGMEKKFRAYIQAEQAEEKRTFIELSRLAKRWG